ncbi:hypothetical protein HYR99_36225 [Candidatus Poribacteria bacterium]|nr:hypothetical protein [Candidatus Poribacteria bacterium]
MDENHSATTEYIDACRQPAIQRLRPHLAPSDLVLTEANRLRFASEINDMPSQREKLIWLPTLDQLLSMLSERSQNPCEPLLRPCEGGWECVVTLSEWATDYGTFVDAQRRFVGTEPRLVVLRALKAAIGAGERWMV